MGTVAKIPAGANADRDMAAFALTSEAWGDEVMERFAEIGGDPEGALARLNAMTVPAKDREARGVIPDESVPSGYRFEGKTRDLSLALRAIGAKISPTMSEEQVGVWLSAMVTALSDLPFAFSIKGAQEAIHVPMKFLNEVEGVVREKAEGAATRHRLAVYSIRRFMRQLEEAKKSALPPPPPRVWTQEDVDQANEGFAKCGIKTRFKLDPDDPEGVKSYMLDDECDDGALAQERKD